MRTTIRIDDGLYREVKAKAARSGRTVAAVLEDAVRRGLEPSEPQASVRYRVRSTGAGGLQAGVDISSSGGIAEVLDESIAFDALP